MAATAMAMADLTEVMEVMEDMAMADPMEDMAAMAMARGRLRLLLMLSLVMAMDIEAMDTAAMEDLMEATADPMVDMAMESKFIFFDPAFMF